jgi:transcriptional regulator with XRE-family HTH domain
VDYSRRIRGLRSRLKLNQQQFAEKLSVSQATVSRWEKGQQIPSIDALTAMRALGTFEDGDLIDDVRLSFGGRTWGRSINLVGSIETSKLVDSIEWPIEDHIEITIPDIAAWRDFELKAFVVSDETKISNYSRGSFVIVTPFELGKIEPKDSDIFVFAEKHERTGRYEVSLGEYNENEHAVGFTIGISTWIVQFSETFWDVVSQYGSLEAVGFYGLVLGGFVMEDTDRLGPRKRADPDHV